MGGRKKLEFLWGKYINRGEKYGFLPRKFINQRRRYVFPSLIYVFLSKKHLFPFQKRLFFQLIFEPDTEAYRHREDLFGL